MLILYTFCDKLNIRGENKWTVRYPYDMIIDLAEEIKRMLIASINTAKQNTEKTK